MQPSQSSLYYNWDQANAAAKADPNNPYNNGWYATPQGQDALSKSGQDAYISDQGQLGLALQQQEYTQNLAPAAASSPTGQTAAGQNYADQAFQNWKATGATGIASNGNGGYGIYASPAVGQQVSALGALSRQGYANAAADAAAPIRGLDATGNDAGRANQMAAYSAYQQMANGGAPSAAQAQYGGQVSGLANQAGALMGAGGARNSAQAIAGLSGGAQQANLGFGQARQAEIQNAQAGMAGQANAIRSGDMGFANAQVQNTMARQANNYGNMRADYSAGNAALNQGAQLGVAGLTGDADRFVNFGLKKGSQTIQQNGINFAGAMNTIGYGVGAANGAIQGLTPSGSK